MDLDSGGLSSDDRRRQTAAAIARKRVLAAFSGNRKYRPKINNLPKNAKDIIVKPAQNQPTASLAQSSASEPKPAGLYTPEAQPQLQSQSQSQTLKDTPIDTTAVNENWQKYHSAWQNYYQNYYNEYYTKAAQSYIATEKMKDQRIATGKVHRARNWKRLAPVIILATFGLALLFLQYNRLIFAPIMAYVAPGNNPAGSLEAIDPTITGSVSPEPRLLIPKLNVDVPVVYQLPVDDVMDAMNHGVAQFAIPGANAMPGEIGNLAISGHSAGDIYSSNPYKFIFSGLERLVEGDLIYINYESTRYTYRMTGSQVVNPSDVQALIYPTDKPILTLITCTPLGTSRYRLLIIAEQISPSYTSETVTPDDTPAEGEIESDPTPTENMPANEPSFFESLWQGIFGS